MAAALASAYRIKGNRRRLRRRTSGRTIYAYVSGNPINRIDPFGLTECDINAAVGFAKDLVEREGLGGIDVPGRVSVGELHGRGANVTGVTEKGYFFRPVTLDNRYLMELTDAGAVALLGTVLHEGMHRDWKWGWTDGSVTQSEHDAIYQRTSALKQQFGDEFLKARKQQCGCQ